jgi:hypothetical protein
MPHPEQDVFSQLERPSAHPIEEIELATQPGERAWDLFTKQDVEQVEIVVPEGVPRIFLVPADCVPQLGADWVVVQPDVFRKDARRGWEPVRDQSFLGRAETTRIQFGPHGPEVLCELRVDDEGGLRILNLSDDPVRLIARGR